MSDVTTIPFEKPLGHQTVVHRIEWWRPDSRFVVVRYSQGGELNEFGMRLDLDKRSFLDRFDNDRLDANLQSLVPEISSLVSAFRSDAPASPFESSELL